MTGDMWQIQCCCIEAILIFFHAIQSILFNVIDLMLKISFPSYSSLNNILSLYSSNNIRQSKRKWNWFIIFRFNIKKKERIRNPFVEYSSVIHSSFWLLFIFIFFRFTFFSILSIYDDVWYILFTLPYFNEINDLLAFFLYFQLWLNRNKNNPNPYRIPRKNDKHYPFVSCFFCLFNF